MKAKTKSTHGRAPGKTQISISLPKPLVDMIDTLAAAENRNRSNFIATAMERLVDGTLFPEIAAADALPPVSNVERTAPARRR